MKNTMRAGLIKVLTAAAAVLLVLAFTGKEEAQTLQRYSLRGESCRVESGEGKVLQYHSKASYTGPPIDLTAIAKAKATPTPTPSQLPPISLMDILNIKATPTPTPTSQIRIKPIVLPTPLPSTVPVDATTSATQVRDANKGKLLHSGEVGMVDWEIYASGLFRLKGAGPMSNYRSDDPAPWAQYAEDIKVVEIDGNIDNIPDYAFYGCYAMKELYIGYGVERIGASAFCDCTSLDAINIPNSVEYIESAAFYNCDSALVLSLGKSVRKIESYAFFGCKAMTATTLPLSLELIGDYAFYGCRLESISYDGYPNDLLSISVGMENPPIFNEYIYCVDPEKPWDIVAVNYSMLVASYCY